MKKVLFIGVLSLLVGCGNEPLYYHEFPIKIEVESGAFSDVYRSDSIRNSGSYTVSYFCGDSSVIKTSSITIIRYGDFSIN